MIGLYVSNPTAIACSESEQVNSRGRVSATINSETICFPGFRSKLCNALSTGCDFFSLHYDLNRFEI